MITIDKFIKKESVKSKKIIQKDFTSELDRQSAKYSIIKNVLVLNKDKSIHKIYEFYDGTSLDEMQKQVKKDYPNKELKLVISLKD